MAQKIYDLQSYDLLKLANGQEFKIVAGGYGYGDQDMFIKIYSENHSLEELEAVFSNPNNLTYMEITDANHQNLFAKLYNFTILKYVAKEYHSIYYEGYNDDGQYIKLVTDLFKIELRKPTIEDKLPQYEATMEYIAIMADIDIDEE